MSFKKVGNLTSYILKFFIQNVLFLTPVLDYSSLSKAYRVYNNRTFCLEESIHVAFEETQNDKKI
jgi:hypothetical protein